MGELICLELSVKIKGGIFMRKVVVVLLAIALGVTFGFSAAKKYEGEKVELSLATFPPLDVAYNVTLQDFYKQFPNIKVEVKALGYGDHHNMLVTALAAGKGLPDVTVVEIGYVAQLGAGGGFENLLEEPYNAGVYKKDFTPYKWAQGSLGPRNLFAMPVDIAPGCVWYRKDVFDERKVDINKIADIEDLFKAGKTLTFDADGDGKVDHWLLGGANYIFNMIFFSAPQRYFDKNGKPALNAPRIKLAVSWAKKFRDAGLDAKIGDWSNEWYAALKDGTISYTPSGAWLGGHLKQWIAPDAKGKYRVAELPRLNKKDKKPMKMSQGGSFLSIPKKIDDSKKGAAWEVIRWFCTRIDAQLIAYDKADAFPAYMPAWKDKIFEEGIDYIGGQKARVLWRQIAMEIPEVYINEKDSIANSILSQALSEVLEGKKDVDTALADAQREMEEKME